MGEEPHNAGKSWGGGAELAGWNDVWLLFGSDLQSFNLCKNECSPTKQPHVDICFSTELDQPRTGHFGRIVRQETWFNRLEKGPRCFQVGVIETNAIRLATSPAMRL